MKARPKDVEIENGMVQPTKGVSINSNISEAAKYGKPHLVGDLPDGLQIVHTAGTHYEIAPRFAMTMESYQELLYTVPLFPAS